jgi:hypothetical protein
VSASLVLAQAEPPANIERSIKHVKSSVADGKVRLAGFTSDAFCQAARKEKPGSVKLRVWRLDLPEFRYSTRFVGSFDWQRLSIDVRIPDGLRDISIDAGLNGTTGKMWTDDVELSRLPD